jgi:cytidylate kinase
MNRKKIIIAIDGHSSCGKSTMAKVLSKQIGYTYIDSGAMYRAVTLFCLQNRIFQNNQINEELLKNEIKNIHISFEKNEENGKSETFLNGKNVENEIRSMDVADKVSIVAAIRFVRKEMVKQQQNMGLEKGIVMDGRDIGTIVFPEAELKIFVTAKPEIRARRRFDELIAKGENTTFDEVIQNLIKRDHIDSTRQDSPLRQAADAIIIDNSLMTMEEQNQYLLNLFQEKIREY